MNEKESHTDCMVCGSDLNYDSVASKKNCYICGDIFDSNIYCVNSHYVCDQCHIDSPIGVIKKFCMNTKITDPVELALTLMRNKKVKMHGPEHHFLVAAVLITSYYNFKNDMEGKLKKIETAEKRASKVPGGFCGFFGTCGAAVGSGIFISAITGSTPVAIKEWHLCNLMTSKSLNTIANKGGPRCCKRNTLLAIYEAVNFLREHFDTKLEVIEDIKCEFNHLNKECIKQKCPYYPQ
jgi:predicted RNA-binding Zn-ribbon protein involved in translation (DUF1610 family)